MYDWVGLVSSVDELVKPVLSATPMTATTARAVPAIPAPEICLPLTDGPRPASVTTTASSRRRTPARVRRLRSSA
ncbi:hypothetical protein NJ76_31130, partial [Rhodococcus sp. IITR03]